MPQFKAIIDKFIHSINELFQDNKLEDRVLQYDGLKAQNGELIKIQFVIHTTKERELHYLLNDQLLQTVKHYDFITKPQIITNLEEVIHLKWIGEFGKTFKKVGLWKAKWKGENLIGCGGEYDITQKNNILYSLNVGEYVDGLRKGYWKYIFENQEIGGGQCNAFSNKDGNWIELSDMFWRDSQITYHGGYMARKLVDGIQGLILMGKMKRLVEDLMMKEVMRQSRGIGLKFWMALVVILKQLIKVNIKMGKIGRWDIFFRNFNEKDFSKIGGGSYVEEYEGVKIGKWIDLDEGFMTTSQVTFQGEYQKGKKVNKWDIFLIRMERISQCKQDGGGVYDQQEGKNQSLVKFGKWVELGDGFNDCCYFTYQGEYSNNQKVGRWNSYFQDKLIGGGTYNEKAIKHGQWIELCDNFYMFNQVTYIGQFQNGKKVGLWYIMKVKINDENLIFEKIGEKHYQFEKKY